jgi:hypothetical protein
MTAQFHAALPDVPVLRGDGDTLPLADASHHLATYAQSWHWTDTTRSVPESLRVARRQLHWSRTVTLDTHLANIGSRSVFSTGAVGETCVVDLLVATRH